MRLILLHVYAIILLYICFFWRCIDIHVSKSRQLRFVPCGRIKRTLVCLNLWILFVVQIYAHWPNYTIVLNYYKHVVWIKTNLYLFYEEFQEVLCCFVGIISSQVWKTEGVAHLRPANFDLKRRQVIFVVFQGKTDAQL